MSDPDVRLYVSDYIFTYQDPGLGCHDLSGSFCHVQERHALKCMLVSVYIGNKEQI